MKRLRFGIKTAPQHTSYEAMLELWKQADALPIYEHAWLFDHFAPIVGDLDGPCFEGWTLLAAYAAQTSRIRVGLMVTGNTYRHPAVLANTAATLDVISGGRLDYGIGAGWNEYEHNSMGLPLYTPGERLRRFREACEISKRLFTQHLTDFDGKYYQLKEARCEPKPIQKPYPPFVIGGSGEQLTLKIVAEYADIWNYGGGTVETFNHKVEVLRGHCETVGRNFDDIELSIQRVVNYDNFDETVEDIQQFVDAGATHIILNFRPPFPEGIVQRVADELIPRIKPRQA